MGTLYMYLMYMMRFDIARSKKGRVVVVVVVVVVV